MTIEILCLICVPSAIAWFLGVAFADFLEWCQHVDWTFSVATPVMVEEIPDEPVAVTAEPAEETPEPEVVAVAAEPVTPPAIAGELTDNMVLDTMVFGPMSVSPVVSKIVCEHLSSEIVAPAGVMVDETPIEEISRVRGAIYLEDVKFSGVRSPMVRPSVAKRMVARQHQYIEAFVPMEAVQ